MVLIGILLYMFLAYCGPKWSGKAQNKVIMNGNYSQTPYGDFWTDSGTSFLFPESGQTRGNVQEPEKRFFGSG